MSEAMYDMEHWRVATAILTIRRGFTEIHRLERLGQKLKDRRDAVHK